MNVRQLLDEKVQMYVEYVLPILIIPSLSIIDTKSLKSIIAPYLKVWTFGKNDFQDHWLPYLVKAKH